MNDSDPPTDSPPRQLGNGAFDAVIFALDGVVTRTAEVHAAAWKALFDAFLQQHAATTGQPFAPFDLDADYRRQVDGKPRYDGVADFLKSRGITLARGEPADAPDLQTACGLGNRKSALFLAELEKGVPVYASTIELIHQLRAQGIKTAIISADENCAAVLDAARITGLFDARVDGLEATRLGLADKPAPDVFLQAAQRLAVTPARTVVVEHAIAGVQAGRRGGFGLVIGVDRNGHAPELQAAGAHWVVADLAEVAVVKAASGTRQRSDELPSALAAFADIKAHLKGKRLVVFLDYDGTLTPIVERPELAVLSDEVRIAVRALAQRCTVLVMSGRDLRDVQARVGLPEIVYGGSHGFEIGGPAGRHTEQQHGAEFLPGLDQTERLLRERLGPIPGLQVERKKYAITVHFRRVQAADLAAVEPAVDAVLAESPGLRKTCGKMIFEVQPDIEWDKGRAMIWLLDSLGLQTAEDFVLYLGDDITDEDAFGALAARGNGLGILVRDEARDAARPTAAHYALANSQEVQRLLEQLAAWAEGASA